MKSISNWPMNRVGFGKVVTVAAIVLSQVGCGTPKEKTAPCKRPANLANYVADLRTACGPMRAVNTDRKSALAVINDFADQMK